MPNRNFSASSYRYGFNGKENDPESGTQDYGMRIYNPSLGKFLSVDPLSDEYPWNSTYAFAENDVIRCIDLDGSEKTQPAFYQTNTGWTTAIDNTGRSAMPEVIARDKVYQALHKPSPLTNYQTPYRGTISQGGEAGRPEYIATVTNMDNIATMTVPFYDPIKTKMKGGEVSKTEMAIEVATILPIFRIGGKVGGSIIKYLGEGGQLLLKGAGKQFMCKEFAADFMTQIAPILEKEGNKVEHMRIDLNDQAAVIGNLTDQMANNGIHEFIKVTKGKTTFVFDNIYTKGIEISKYMEELAGSSAKAGKTFTGEKLVEMAKPVAKTLD